jgi:AcrR family transcriptional regulator
MEMKPRQLEIIEATGRILTTHGVNGLTIKNLAKEMHFSESAIYRHFTSKEEIIFELLNYLAESTETRLGYLKKSDILEENFMALFVEQFNFFSKYPYFVVAVFSDGLMEESQRIKEVYFKLMFVVMTYLMPIITQGQQKGLFINTISAEQLVHIIMGSFKLQMFKWKVFDFKSDLTLDGHSLAESMLLLIKNK